MYESVLENEIPFRGVNLNLVTKAIAKIRKTYRRISSDIPLPEIDYNDVEYRYAYIYLYSVCHSTVVELCAKDFASKFPIHFDDMMKYNRGEFSVCSLGGGPGCDVFGLLTARLERIELFGTVRFCVVDLYEGWKASLQYSVAAFSQIHELSVQGVFIAADLCDDLPQPVVEEIQNCDVLSMVKFASVASSYYKRRPEELENIFNLMKPGAYVFYLDNSEGGFYEIVSDAAKEAGLKLAFPPKIARWVLDDNYLDNGRFTVAPLSSMSVCFAVWEKPRNNWPCSIL